MKIENQIKILRESQGMSISKLADESGVPKSSISTFEAGKSSMLIQNFEKIADILGCDVVLINKQKTLDR